MFLKETIMRFSPLTTADRYSRTYCKRYYSFRIFAIAIRSIIDIVDIFSGKIMAKGESFHLRGAHLRTCCYIFDVECVPYKRNGDIILNEQLSIIGIMITSRKYIVNLCQRKYKKKV